MRIWLYSLRRSGTHLASNIIEGATGYPVFNNFQAKGLDNAHKEGKKIDLPKDCILVLEDHNLIVSKKLEKENYYPDVIGEGENVVIVNIRDVANLMASRIKMWDLMSSEGKCITNHLLAVGDWGSYLQAYIKNEEITKSRTHYICFNRLVDKDSQQDELDQLFNFLDKYAEVNNAEGTKSLGYVSVHGRGSSFDNNSNQNERYKYYMNCPAFTKMFGAQDKVILNKYFGICLDNEAKDIKEEK